MMTKLLALCAAMAALAAAQNPVHAESTSSISVSGKGVDRTVEIHNVSYQYTETHIPGRPKDELLTLRVTTHAKDVLGDIPEPGSVTLEAWPLGVDPRQKPLYTVKTGGAGARTIDNALWVVDRGFVDLPMWSMYQLGSGQHLFDTYVDLVRFSITKDVQTIRYVGIDVPPDDTKDARLKEPHVVAVLTYAAGDRVIRELLLTHANPAQARELRSYADTTRTISFGEMPAKRLAIKFAPNIGGGASADITVPLKGDDLDAATAKLPPGMSLKPWNRGK